MPVTDKQTRDLSILMAGGIYAPKSELNRSYSAVKMILDSPPKPKRDKLQTRDMGQPVRRAKRHRGFEMDM